MVRPKRIVASWFGSFALVLLGAAGASAADLDDAHSLFLRGEYEAAEAMAAEQVDRGIWNERWPRLLIRCQMATGNYADAKTTYENAIKRYPTSLTLRMQGLDVLRHNNLPDEVTNETNGILRLLQSSPSRYASRDNLVAAGRYFTMRGEDARQVLQLFFDRVRDSDPTHLEAYLATAELALDKGDFKVASETLTQAQSFAGRDPRVPYLLTRAWDSSDAEKAEAALQQALEWNPRHVPSLLYRADAAIDREQYDAAEAWISQVLEINMHQQEAWALLAVIAHLGGQYEREKLMRAAALSTWADNPRVDHRIGWKLSQKYRFEEGAEYQRSAIKMDPRFTPARFQLAQDHLRLGHEDVGWELAKRVADEDQYNVVAHNLVTLNDRINGFQVLQSDGIHVRMETRESNIYGEEVLGLLIEAKRILCEKYDVQPRTPIVVEIFPEQKDFAIRTFGLPGGAGFLGVCFGRVITANSPASQGERPANWQSVLWHEFCHVVTLEKTKNRMPRWLSEGISVFEERQRDPSWGESMTPVYRQMLLAEDLTAVSDLSAAFLSPPSPVHLQFAYYESSLVVEFLVDRYGLDALKQILDDLGDGLAINDALVRNVGSLQKLDSEFSDYARKHAENFAAEADWSRESLPEKPSPEELTAWVREHPTNYWGLRTLAENQVAAKKFEQAKVTLEKLRSLGSFTGDRGDPLELSAGVYRELDDKEAEREALQRIISLSSDALPALRRLIEIARDGNEWDVVAQCAGKMTAINPLLPDAQLAVAEAAEMLDRPRDVVRSLTAASQMDPVDPAGVHYRLARAHAELDQFDRAKDHLLRALDDAPRYRDALRLLLEVNEQLGADQNSSIRPDEGKVE